MAQLPETMSTARLGRQSEPKGLRPAPTLAASRPSLPMTSPTSSILHTGTTIHQVGGGQTAIQSVRRAEGTSMGLFATGPQSHMTSTAAVSRHSHYQSRILVGLLNLSTEVWGPVRPRAWA